MSTAAPEPLDPNFRIELPAFEGPLDLLLHLIAKHELEILDLPVAFVTEKYLQYLKLMKELDLDIASEYLVMAAKLAYIKSRTLLPVSPLDQDDEAEEELGDPRLELISRLLQYQKYKKVAEELADRGVTGRDVFARGTAAPKHDGPAPLASFDLFKLLDAFQKVLGRLDDSKAFEIDAERISIQARISQMTDVLREKRRCNFDELFEGLRTKYDLVVTFLALLEMAKMRLLFVYQADASSLIHLEYRLIEDPDAEATEFADILN